MKRKTVRWRLIVGVKEGRNSWLFERNTNDNNYHLLMELFLILRVVAGKSGRGERELGVGKGIG
jgi:hypothetical protein